MRKRRSPVIMPTKQRKISSMSSYDSVRFRPETKAEERRKLQKMIKDYDGIDIENLNPEILKLMKRQLSDQKNQFVMSAYGSRKNKFRRKRRK